MLTSDRLQNARFTSWVNFRNYLENAEDPFKEVSSYFLKLPRVKVYTDPYDSSTWPTAWELIAENEYCEFNIILGICYTLQLTERFKDSQPIIKVMIDNHSRTVYYLLFLKDKVYGYLDEEWIDVNDLPKSLKIQKIYHMRPLH